MQDAIDEGLRAVTTAVDLWVAGLHAVALPDDLVDLAGGPADAPLRLRTRRFRGRGHDSLTVATIVGADGHLRSATVIGMPAPTSLGPVVGIDLIGFGGALSLVAVDLAPTDPAAWEATAAPLLADLHAAVDARVVPRKWPGFARDVFSPRALIAGVRRGDEVAVLAAVATFVAALAALEPADHDPADARVAAVAQRVSAWRRAELANRREHDALARLFGAAPAAAYLELLFGAA